MALKALHEEYWSAKKSGDALVMYECKMALHSIIKELFNIYIPTKVVKKGNSAPIDFVADCFFGDNKDIIAIANRNGGKTLDFAILDVLVAITFDDCEIATLGAIEAQAKRCYSYVQKFVNNIPPFSKAVTNSLMSQTDFVNESKIEILVATMSGVNSPHPQKVFLDEVDLMDWNILQEAFSMALSKPGIEGQNIITSTRKFVNGPMSKMLKEAKKSGTKVYIWSIYESIEPHHVSETKGTPLYDDFKDFYDENGMFPSDGFYTVKDAIAKKKKLDPDIWESQWLCENPEQGGLMYPQFVDEQYPAGNLVDYEFNPLLPTYIFEDFGFGKDHPDVTLFVQIDWRDSDLPIVYVFDENYQTKGISSDHVGHVADKLQDEYQMEIDFEWRGGKEFYNFSDLLEGWIPDPRGLTEIEDRLRMGCPMLEKAEPPQLYSRILNGVSLLRVLFRNKQLRIGLNCVKLREELMSYSRIRLPDGSWSDQPKKKQDHGPDALRYGGVTLMPMQAVQAYGGFFKDGEDDDDDQDFGRDEGPITKDTLNMEY